MIKERSITVQGVLGKYASMWKHSAEVDEVHSVSEEVRLRLSKLLLRAGLTLLTMVFPVPTQYLLKDTGKTGTHHTHS